MTPEERRVKWPLLPVMRMDNDEIEQQRSEAEEWLARPELPDPSIDAHYHLVARLIATLDECRGKYLMDIVE